MTVFQGVSVIPGQGRVVRTLMFIGGTIGIVLGLFLGALYLFGSELASYGAWGVVSALIASGYGVFSVTLAALMGRRKKGVFRGVVAFNVAASLFPLLFVVPGDSSSGVPPAFHTVMTGLTFTPRVRAHYGL